MLVTIHSVTAAPCVLCCQKTDDAVEAAFKDGFRGTLCKRHFWDALKARAEQTVPASPERPQPPVKGAQ